MALMLVLLIMYSLCAHLHLSASPPLQHPHINSEPYTLLYSSCGLPHRIMCTWGCLETRSQRQTFLLDKACPLPYRSLHRRHTQTHKNRPCSNAHRAGHADLEQTCRHQRCRPPQTLSNTQAYPQRGSLSMAESGDSVAFSRRRGWECWTNASLGLWGPTLKVGRLL